MTSEKYIQVDEEGFFLFNGLRVSDDSFGKHIFDQMQANEYGQIISYQDGQQILIESFDQALVAQQVSQHKEALWILHLTYGAQKYFRLEDLCLDEWDRFHGQTTDKLPFVFSRKAQNEFFQLLDDFTDDSITSHNKTYKVPNLYLKNEDMRNPEQWSQCYRDGNTPWELDQAHPALGEVLSQIRLAKSRILVLGCGTGNDAALFAEQGHKVVAVDYSKLAIEKAEQKHGHLRQLQFHQMDIFQLPGQWQGQFDLIVEHTCYPAILPERREDLIRVWRKSLCERGLLLGIFFSHSKRLGPPYGSSEWEIHKRLEKNFRFNLWKRLRNSPEYRRGIEFLVFAQKT